MENKQANKQKASDRNGHGRRTTTTEIWKRKAVAEDWNEGKGTGTTTQAWPRTGENKIEQQELRVQPEEAMQLKRIINRKLTTETEKKLENETIRTGMVKLKSAICLPKLKWKKFDGDTLKLHMFCDILSTIHNNQTLQKVDRLKCLESKVWGKATHSLPGLDITNEEYVITVKMLKEHYGELDIMTDAHYSKLTNILPPKSKNSSLQPFQYEGEQHIGAHQNLLDKMSTRDIFW